MSSHEGFESSAEALKVRHRPIFLAMLRANRAWPGGVTEAFRVQSVSPTRALAAFAPDEYNKAPGLLQFLDHIAYIKPRQVVHEIAALADCLTVPSFSSRAVHSSLQGAADDLAAAMRICLYQLDRAPSMPMSARRDLQAQLLRLMDAAHVMYLKLNG